MPLTEPLSLASEQKASPTVHRMVTECVAALSGQDSAQDNTEVRVPIARARASANKKEPRLTSEKRAALAQAVLVRLEGLLALEQLIEEIAGQAELHVLRLVHGGQRSGALDGGQACRRFGVGEAHAVLAKLFPRCNLRNGGESGSVRVLWPKRPNQPSK